MDQTQWLNEHLGSGAQGAGGELQFNNRPQENLNWKVYYSQGIDDAHSIPQEGGQGRVKPERNNMGTYFY